MYNKKKRQLDISSVRITSQPDIKSLAVLDPNLTSGLDVDLGLWGVTGQGGSPEPHRLQLSQAFG